MSKERDFEVFSEIFCAVFSEKEIAVLRQFLRSEPRHILNNTNDRDIDGRKLEHCHSFFGISQGHFLRGAHNYCSCQWNGLYNGKVYISCTGRQVNDEVIQFSPVAII